MINARILSDIDFRQMEFDTSLNDISLSHTTVF